MGSTRRLVIAGASMLAALAIAVGTVSLGSERPATDLGDDRALGTDVAVVAPGPSAPSTTVEVPAPAAAPDRPDVPIPAPDAPIVPEAAEPPAEVPIPSNPVPLPDRSGPTISNIRMSGCRVIADITDPAGVAVATLSWTGVPDPSFGKLWFEQPGSSRMWERLNGTGWEGSRHWPHQEMVFTVTAVDRTLVGNRSSVSWIESAWDYPC